MHDDTAPDQPGGRKRARNPKGAPAEALAKGRATAAANRAKRVAEGKRPTPVRKGTKAGISRDVRIQVLTALNFVGGVKYLARQAEKNPAAFLALVGKCLQQDDGANEAGITFVVQTLNVSGAPIPGVLSSPIAAHVAPPLKLISNGAVLEAEVVGPDE
jgi:hypothetical protein